MLRKRIPFLMLAVSLLLLINNCSMFESFDEAINIDTLKLARSKINTTVGNMEHLNVSVTPQETQRDITLNWSYDENVINVSQNNNFGITFSGKAAGQTSLTCSYGGISDSCIVTVSAPPQTVSEETPAINIPEKKMTDPYIYSNTSILQMIPGGREKIFVSLYGGNAGDTDGYTWTIEDPSVAVIQPTGQYCIIEAKEKGYTRIKITHSKSVYPYYIGVYVFREEINTYITTNDNIITMNQTDNDKEISVSLVNGLPTSNDNSFRWEIIRENDNNPVPVSIDTVANKAVIHPLSGGTCTLRVTHPDAPYPLDIICRIILIVRNVYIMTDYTILDLNDSAEHVISSNLQNIDINYSDTDFSYSIDDTAVAEIVSEIESKVIVRPKANGSCKLTVTHPLAEYPKEVLINVRGQASDANSPSQSIILSTSYIRTKIGAQSSTVEATLSKGGGEEFFNWTVSHKNLNGSTGNVINVEKNRNKVYIEPAAEGTATITVTHPQAVSSQEILVKVLPANAVLEEPLYLTGTGLVKLLNGSTQEYKAGLEGNTTPGDEQDIGWCIADERFTLSKNGRTCIISAPATGAGTIRTVMTISHPKADNSKTVNVISADDEETLSSIKLLVTNKNYYNLNIGDEDIIGFVAEGFTDEEFNYSHIQWTVSNPDMVQIEPIENTTLCRIKCLKSGTTSITAKHDSYSCSFTIYVYPAGIVNFNPEAYLTTNNNYINIYNINDTATAYIHANNLSAVKCQEITWFTEDSSVISILPNGTDCTVRALSAGNATLYASHPDCVNRIKFFIAVCGQNLPDVKNSESITCQQNYIQLKPGAKDTVITVNLHNLGSGAENGLCWTITENPLSQGTAVISAITPTGTITDVFQQSQVPVQDKKSLQYGKIAIKPLNPGTATILVRHPQSKNSVSIAVKVDSGSVTEESLYFSGPNIITFTNDKSYFYNVMLNGVNKTNGDESSISWVCDNDVFSVLANGRDAMILSSGSGINQAHITISHPKVLYEKNVLVLTADTEEQLSQMRTIYMPSTSYNVNVSSSFDIPLRFYGYETIDNDRVVWSSSNPETASVTSGRVTGIKPGTAEIRATYYNSTATAKVYVYPAGTDVSNEPSESQGSGIASGDENGIRLSIRSDDIRLESSKNGRTINLSVKDDIYDSYRWTLDDEDMNETSPRITIDTKDMAEGTYDLTLFASKGTMFYSAFIQIQIQ